MIKRRPGAADPADGAVVKLEPLADDFESRTAQELLAWAVDRFAGRIVLTLSLAKDEAHAAAARR